MRYNQETYEAIKNRILLNIDDIVDKREGSFVNNMVSPVSVEFAKHYIELDNILSIMFLEGATGEYLDKKVNDFAVYRKTGTNAYGTIQVEGSVGTYIPKNSIVLSQSELEFYTLADIWLDEGINHIEVISSEVGEKYNIIASSIDKFKSKVNGIESITNENEFTGGTNRETDEELIERFFEIIRRPATSGNIYHYEQWAKEIDGINQARVKPLWNGNGTVKVIVSNDNDIVPDDVLQACKDYIEEVRPIGANVTVITPSALELNIKANIEVINGYDATKVKLEVENNILEYLKTCDSEVTYTKIASCIGKVVGVEDYNTLLLNNSTSNISFNDEQIPKLKSLELEVI